MRSPPALILGLALAACSKESSTEVQSPEATTEATAEPTPSPKASSAPKEEPVSDDVPLTCESQGKLCLPKPGFAKRLCQNVYPDVALAWFRKGTPFSRGYLRGAVDAWNASGGVSSGDKLVFDEEVIVLFERKNKTGIEVSGASGGYDVLRWDGSCATLSGEEMTFSVPPEPKTAKIEWRYIGEAVQNALLADEKIAKLNKQRRDECKGATMGDVSKKCVTAVDGLGKAITSYVRNGGDIPAPAKLK